MKYNRHSDNEATVANDPTVAYATPTAAPSARYAEAEATPSIQEGLPSEYIRMALECALADERHGRLIPNDQVLEVLHKKMGWK